MSPVSGLFAATKAIADAYGLLREHGTMRENLDRLIGFDDFTDLVGLPAVQALEQRYGST